MEKLEAILLIVVLVAAVVGLYYIYAGTGEAVRTLPGCKGGYTMKLLATGTRPIISDKYHFRGASGTIELAGMLNNRAKLRVDGVDTPYLGFREVWVGDKIGVKMSEVTRDSASFCLASNTAECTDYAWNYDTKRRECGRWTSQVELLFS